MGNCVEYWEILEFRKSSLIFLESRHFTGDGEVRWDKGMEKGCLVWKGVRECGNMWGNVEGCGRVWKGGGGMEESVGRWKRVRWVTERVEGRQRWRLRDRGGGTDRQRADREGRDGGGRETEGETRRRGDREGG